MKPTWESKCGTVKLWLADCLDVLPTLEAGSVDAVVTDPPYGTQQLGGGYGRGHGTIANDDDLEALRTSLPEILRVLSQGWLMMFYAARRTREIAELTHSLHWFGEIVWDKSQPGLGYHIRYSHETVAVFRIGEPDRPPEPIFSLLRATTEADYHPHQKPLAVMLKLTEWACPAGGVLLDPFMGSGSTIVAGLRNGRRCIGIESDTKHFETAVRRIESELRQPRLFPALTPKETQGELFGESA